MQLACKSDFEEARRYWDAFWQGEIIDRPYVYITAPKEGAPPAPRVPYPALIGGDYEAFARVFDAAASRTWYGAEAIPNWTASFGPDQFAAFLGAEMRQDPEVRTSWVQPFVHDWNDALPLRFDPDNRTWSEMRKLLEAGVRVGGGRWLIQMLDLHTNLDALQAIRGGVEMCTDLYDTPPELVDRALDDAYAVFERVYEEVYRICRMEEWGCISWTPFYSRGRLSTVQCDFLYLISPEHARRFAIPAIRREAAFLDHVVFHLDGENSLVHLDDLLAIPEIDVIQWVPGAGSSRPRHSQWLELFKKIQAAGKGLQVNAGIDEIKTLHRELRPEKVLYVTRAQSRAEGEAFLDWLRRHT